MGFRILSIDGGGVRGIVAARILEVIEQQLNQPLRDYFDLIVGTSTGALIATGLMVGYSPSKLVELYLSWGEEIFPYRSWFNPRRLPLLWRYGVSAPKFSDDGLIRVVRSLNLDQPLAAVSPDTNRSTKLMIISYDTIRRSPVFFKSWRHQKWYAQVPLWQACVSSAAAPTYFPAQRLLIRNQGHEVFEFSLIDGSVGANNPVACGVAEAIRLLRAGQVPHQQASSSLEQIVSEISVLSVGTGALCKPIPWQEVRGWGLLQWAPHIVDVILDAPADIHRYIAQQIVTEAGMERPQNYLRLQPELDQRYGAIDNASAAYLQKLLRQTDAYLSTQASEIAAFLPVESASLSF